MAISRRGASVLNPTGTGSPWSYALPVTTNAGDLIVVGYTVQANPTLTVSGAGATWTQYGPFGGAPGAYLAIGVNASAGQTSINIASSSTTAPGAVIAVFSGADTSASAVVQHSTSTTPTIANNLASAATSGNLVVATAALFGSITLSSWTNGQANTNDGLETVGGRDASLDHVIMSSTATQGATYTAGNASIVAEIKAATTTAVSPVPQPIVIQQAASTRSSVF